jgi:anti-sigma regulatory factor (Ser/Thr protein kinase)
VPPERRADLLLVLSELVSNAVKYGCRPDDTVRVEIAKHGGAIELRVSDAARGSAPRLLSGDHGSSSGRGLRVVDRLVDEWTDEIRDGRRVVRCSLTVSDGEKR